MWSGTYRKWTPLPQFTNKGFFAAGLEDGENGLQFRFELDEPKLVLTISFDSDLLYMTSDEADRLMSVELEGPHLFWKIEDSGLLRQFHQLSMDTHKHQRITHFAFLSHDDCIDVLALDEPKISWEQG